MHPQLVVLHTNDIHSNFELMPNVAAAIRGYRERYKADKTLTIDCGDHMDRMSMVTESSDGLGNVEVMNTTGYEFHVPGNREGIIFTKYELDKLYGKHANFQVICSNLSYINDAPSWLLPYQIIERDGLNIGIIGLTSTNKTYATLGWNIVDPVETAANLVSLLRRQVHILVLMSHLGLRADKRLVEEVQGIDLIFGAHSHDLLETPLNINGTYIFAAGAYGGHVGVAEIEYDLQAKMITSVKGCCVDVTRYHRDLNVSEVISRYESESRKKLENPIIEITSPMKMNWEGESELGNLLAAGVRRHTNAEIGIINAGQFMGGLEAGEITSYHLLNACPSPARPCLTMLKGKHIRKALEESLLEEFIGKKIKGFGFSGKVIGALCVDGMELEYDANKAPYAKISKIWVNGERIEEEREYSVGTIDAFSFGLGYPSLGEGRDNRYFPIFMRHILQEQLQNQSEIAKSGIARRQRIN